ncbi:N-acetyl-alpha-D-glucosaminyl L-malate synthase [Alteripontixanthobacter maritimus]|uniref:N-acetyl-alpha-D-glucosaminyl L-malate synthase n=1 Tax=Alteripontixanthobacter maritimus TaxID=2161824 RepID=A0A369Q7F7_9SPHN|nr:glycosyltransferase family 4 protein [Alteripontixanthobacter maritimus]RDC60402.1 N-acetyl-alpha-D-glucosaminyl L-malate synthase [Alteripontixanthobacter maritimus]
MTDTKSGRSNSLPRILHCHSTFAAGGKELRSVDLINAMGPKLQHVIVAEDGDFAAGHRVAPGMKVSYLKQFPSLKGTPTPGRLLKLAKAAAGYDLVLTYNWGAVDMVMAHTLYRDAVSLPPLIHHEDGFNEDERNRLKTRRNWYRRIALGRSNGLVVPSETLEQISLETWQQPMGRVKLIPNGIDTGAFTKKPKKDALRGTVKRPGEKWVGTLAGLRPIKNLPRLVRAFAGLPEEWQLVIVGEGPEMEAIREEADRLDIGHRLLMPGFVPDPARYIGLFDIFALSSDSEQFPISVVEAMATGLPVAAPAMGDIPHMVAPENASAIVQPGSDAELSRALRMLADDEALRNSIGVANRNKAQAKYTRKQMVDTYRRLYSSAMGLGPIA